jgi:nucleoside-diphosphate-sugar epimerase
MDNILITGIGGMVGSHLAELGTIGDVYNISGEKVYKIADILEIIRQYALINFDFKTDESLLCPTDEAIIYGDSTKLKSQTGWEQKFSINETIKDMLDYWRKHT